MSVLRNVVLSLFTIVLTSGHIEAQTVRTFNASGTAVSVWSTTEARSTVITGPNGAGTSIGGFTGANGGNSSLATDLFISNNAKTDVVFGPADPTGSPQPANAGPTDVRFDYGPTTTDGAQNTNDIAKLRISDGTVTVTAGTTLRMPGGIEVTGNGTFNAQGSKLGEAYIEAITYPAASATVNDRNKVTLTLDRDVSGVISTDNFLVVMDEDPYGTSDTLTARSIQVDTGRNKVGAHRPSFAKWIWIDITSMTVTSGKSVITGEFDEWEGSADLGGSMTYDGKVGMGGSAATSNGGSPYLGTRGNVVRNPEGLQKNESWWFGTATRFQLDTTLVSGNHAPRIDGDFTSQYLEIVASSDDPTCDGKMAKVMTTTQFDAGNTTTSGDIFVAGDLSHCGVSATVRITNGLRVGDKVALVRPVTLDFSNVTTGVVHPSELTGYFYWGGGTVQIEWARFIRMGSLGRDKVSSDLSLVSRRFACNICIFRKDADSEHTGYIRNSNVAYLASHVYSSTPSSASMGDTVSMLIGEATYNYGSVGQANGLKRFATPLDMSGVSFDRLYFHDAVHNERSDNLLMKTPGGGTEVITVADLGCGIESGEADRFAGSKFGTTSGVHFWINEADNLSMSRIRVARFTDDGFGLTAKTGGYDNWNQRMNISHIIVEESIACTPNSQEGVSLSMSSTMPGRASPDNPTVNPLGAKNISDVEALYGQVGISDLLSLGAYGSTTNSIGNFRISGLITSTGFGAPAQENAITYNVPSGQNKSEPQRGGDSANTWFQNVDYGACTAEGVPSQCCTGAGTGTCRDIYPRSDSIEYAGTVSNSFIFHPVGGSYLKTGSVVSDSIIQATGLYGGTCSSCRGAATPDSYRSNIGHRYGKVSGTLIQNNYGAYANSGRGCDSGTLTPMAGAWQKIEEMNLLDVILFVPGSHKLGNTLTSFKADESLDDVCPGMTKLVVDRTYVVAGGGATTSNGDGPSLGNGAYLNGTGGMLVNNNLVNSIIKNSTLALTPQGTNYQRSWGWCDLVAAGTACKNSPSQPNTVDDIRENLCVTSRFNNRIKNDQGHYGSRYDQNNHIVSWAGPIAIADSTDIETVTASASFVSFPVASNKGTTIVDFTQPMGSGICGSSRPKRVGFSDWMVTHALMGDFANEQWRNFSTDNLGIEIVDGI